MGSLPDVSIITGADPHFGAETFVQDLDRGRAVAAIAIVKGRIETIGVSHLPKVLVSMPGIDGLAIDLSQTVEERLEEPPAR